MKLINDILRYDSLAVVGLEKNTGKTECLNYVLRNLPEGLRAAVTSIGTDGERVDAVTRTAKPEIRLREGTVFGTAEKYYASRRLVSEILDVGGRATSQGRTVTARALSSGKVMLSGPPSTGELRRWMDTLGSFEVTLTIVDGALSRMSSASPLVAQAMILSTGASFSADMNTLVKETAYRVELIGLPVAPEEDVRPLRNIEKGLWGIGYDGTLDCLSETSGLMADSMGKGADRYRAVYVAGALTARLLEMTGGMRVIVGDFTKIFVPSGDYRKFTARGGIMEVVRRSELLAVCVNPVAPNGIVLDGDRLLAKMTDALSVPVYDIMREYNLGKSAIRLNTKTLK